MKSMDINHRVLIVDDTEAIHDDIRKVLGGSAAESDLDSLEAELFGEQKEGAGSKIPYELYSAYQGQEGFELARRLREQGEPLAMAFIDMRMPPGWDGLQTIEKIWSVDPDMQIVICSAYSDHSWEEIMDRVGQTDKLLILKKPFDPIEVTQLAHSLTYKWSMERQVQSDMERLDAEVERRTRELSSAHDQLKDEVAQREIVEEELRLAQKLEAVGQLAAGIAHEINTPIQFVGDSVYFLKESWADLVPLLEAYQELRRSLAADPARVPALESLTRLESQADLEFVIEQVPQACERAIRGVERVSQIVTAMKEFSHPDLRKKVLSDLNQMIENTLVVAQNEYKYVAQVSTDLGEVDPVLCHPGELGQVFLNLVINAAHAIADVVDESGDQGQIHISTRQIDDAVQVKVSDDGCGIAKDISHRIFDPFFTTKPVGQGTGQGLSMVHKIVRKHGGQITFEPGVPRGTTFVVKLPLDSSKMTDATELVA